MALIIDVDRTLVRFGSTDGQVIACCATCLRETTVLAALVKISDCVFCAGDQASFPIPSASKEFRDDCVRRLYARFRAAEISAGIERPKDQNLLRWLGFTADELAFHVSETMARGCCYCDREIVGFFHVAHIEPIVKIDDPLRLWQTFQLHNIAAAHAECNLQQPRGNAR